MTGPHTAEGARAWSRFQQGEELDGQVPDVILRSWTRCRQAGVDPHEPRFSQISEEDLNSRVLFNQRLISIAEPHLHWLTATLAPLEHAIYLVDSDGIVLLASGEPADLIERVRLLPGVDWSEARMGTNGAGTALAEGAPVAVLGGHHWCRTWHETSCVGAPVRDPGGRVIGAIDLTTSAADGHPQRLLAVRQVAHVVERELMLRHARDVAEGEALRERRWRSRAERETQARDELVAVVTHHLRGPLALVSTAVDILVDHLRPDPHALLEAATQANRIMIAVDRMEPLVRNLLDLRRLDLGALEVVRGTHATLALLDDVANAFEPLATRRKQRVVIELERPSRLVCDPWLTMQALWNLLENASKFSPEGTVIELRCRLVGSNCRISVHDSGPGVPHQDLPRVFERHFQGSGQRRQGIGLGLYIARAFVEAQGGNIWAESAEQGSVFYVELPLAR